jgi:hypothetical protein
MSDTPPKFGERLPADEPEYGVPLQDWPPSVPLVVHGQPKADGDRAASPAMTWALIGFLVLVPLAIPVNVAVWQWVISQ